MMNKTHKTGFTPISLDEYVELHLRANRGSIREEIIKGLQGALDDYQNGAKCGCGNPIWVVGSAVAGNGCFTCITGEAVPENDYEIDIAI